MEPQQKGKYSVMFINRSPTIYQKFSNLSNCLEANQCINDDRWDQKNCHPHHYFPQTCREKQIHMSGLKWPTDNLQSQKLSPSPRPSKSLRSNQIHMSGLDMSHWQFAITPEDRLQDQWMLIKWIWYTQVNNQQNKSWANNLKDILDQAK